MSLRWAIPLLLFLKCIHEKVQKRLSTSSNKPLFQKSVLLRAALFLLLVGLTACTAQTPVTDKVVPGTTNPPGANLQPGQIKQFAELLVGFLIAIAFVKLVTQRLKIPYTIGLVLVGLAVSFYSQTVIRPLDPEVILVLLLPPLIFEAVFRINIRELRRALIPISILVGPGVLITTLLVGGVLTLGAQIPLAYALIFGALIAPTDPVAVTALFRSIGAPKRLLSMFEGESLLNDGTSIVLFKLMLMIALTGQVDVPKAILQFFLVAGGGILVGATIGSLFAMALNRIENYVVETTLTVILAYGAYLLGEFFFGVSGVLSVVTAGLMISYLSTARLSPTSRIFISNFWEYVAFIANSFIFLMIGMQSKITVLFNNSLWILWSILAVLFARGIVVWGLRFIHQTRTPVSWSLILYWGGLRGAVSLALALSLSYGLQYRDQIQAMAFGVVLFTLLVQGSTLSKLINRLGLAKQSQPRLQYEQRHARLTALRAAARRLEVLHKSGQVAQYVVDTLGPIVQSRIEQVTQEETQALETEPAVRNQALLDAWHEALRAERSAVVNLYQDNDISDEVYGKMISEIDAMLEDEDKPWSEIPPAQLSAERRPNDRSIKIG